MPFQLHEQGVIIHLRVTPAGRRDRIEKIMTAANGAKYLKVTVTAPPDDGRANEAVIGLLSQEWRLPKTALSVWSGATNKQKKILAAAADPCALLQRLQGLVAGLPQEA